MFSAPSGHSGGMREGKDGKFQSQLLYPFHIHKINKKLSLVSIFFLLLVMHTVSLLIFCSLKFYSSQANSPMIKKFFFVMSQLSFTRLLSFHIFFQTFQTLLQETKNELANPGKVPTYSNSFWRHEMQLTVLESVIDS